MGAVVERGKSAGNGVHYEISYGGRECPFAGIDSTALDPYIGPNQITQNSANVIELTNTLEAISWQQIFSLNSPDIIIGIGDLLGQVFIVSFNVAASTINVNGYPNFPSQTGAYLIGSVAVPNAISSNIAPGTLTFKNVNGICFFSFPWLPYIIQHNNNSAAVLTSYLGCAFLNELNGRLIAANIYQYSAQSITNYAPTGTLNASAAAFSTYPTQRTTDSAVIDGFSSYAPSPSDIIDVNCTLSGSSSSVYNPLAPSVGDYYLQASYDGGATWTTILQGYLDNTKTLTSSNFQAALATASVTNLNLVQLRIEVVSKPSFFFNGTTNVNDTLSITIYLSAVSISVTADSGTPAGVYEFPYQFAWSAASGAYSQFNPLVAGLVTGAGYNNLPDVEDQITGMFMTGPTAYVLRNEGITEVTPLSSGVEPFAFNHLWASHKGIGTIYSNSVMQYGSLGAFLSDSDIYTIGYDGINTIAKKAKQAIYAELITENAANFLCGNLDAFSLKSNVFIGASLAIVQPAAPYEIVIYTFKQDTNEWFRFTIPTNATQSFGMQFASVQAIGVPLLFNAQGSVNDCTIYAMPENCGIQIANDTTTIVFPAEELFFERDVTVDGIGLYIAGVENINTVITCTVEVNGTVFSAINDQEVNMNGDFMYIKLWPTGMPFTGMSPQLTLQASVTGTSNVLDNLTIGKIVLFVTVDPTQRPI